MDYAFQTFAYISISDLFNSMVFFFWIRASTRKHELQIVFSFGNILERF